MPGLVHRYHNADEFAEQLSTTPQCRHRSQLSDMDDDFVSLTDAPTTKSNLSAARATIVDEASSWSEALFPPLQDLQAVIRRFQSDPDGSQDAYFRFLAPLWAIFFAFAVAFNALKPQTYLHRTFTGTQPSPSSADIRVVIAVLLGALLGGLVVIRGVIWCIAEVANSIVGIDSRKGGPLLSSDFLLGGFVL